MNRANCLLWVAMLFLAICISCNRDDITEKEEDSPSINEEVDSNFETNPNENINTAEGTVRILFDSQSVTVTNPYDGKGVVVNRDAADVVVRSTLSNEISYVLSGSTTEGSLKIYSDTKFELVMNGVSIVNSDDPALNIQSVEKATVTLVEGTFNRFAGGVAFVSEGNGEDMKAAFFSEGPLLFSGAGNLVLMGRYRHAVCSDDYIRIDGGNITVALAAKDGIHANDYVEINGGAIDINSMGDGIDSEGTVGLSGGMVKIVTSGEKSHGIKSVAAMTVQTAGSVDIHVQGTAAKAFNCGGDMSVSRGEFRLVTSGDAFYDTDDADISSAAGIKCAGNLTISEGQITIESSGAGGKGINADGKIIIEDGDISVTTTGGQFKYRNDDTAAKAVKCDRDMTVNGGSIVVKTSGVAAEGLESKANMTINKGALDIQAYDDCINASKSIVMNGGTIYCYSTANDGVDSNGTLTITGGTIVSVGSTSPEEGFDGDRNTFKITGGTIIGIGGTTSTPTSNVCTQYSFIYSGSGVAQNSCFNVTSADGVNVLTYLIPKSLNSMTILFSSPGLQKNTSYTISSGGSVSGGTSFYGLYSGATYTGGSSLSTFTTSSMVTAIGSAAGGMGGGGFPGGGGGRP
jgi:hypothetical protein